MSWASTSLSDRLRRPWHECALMHRVEEKTSTFKYDYSCECGTRWVVWRD